MEVQSLWVKRIGNQIDILFEGEDGVWRIAASEYVDNAFSHIVELNHTGNGDDAGQPRPLSDFLIICCEECARHLAPGLIVNVREKHAAKG